MKKQTFVLLFCALLTGCAVIESSPTYSSEAIRRAELGTLSETLKEEPYSDDPDHYKLHIISDSIIIADPNTGIEVYRENLHSNSTLAEAILKDNE